jgi:hypothetical protein
MLHCYVSRLLSISPDTHEIYSLCRNPRAGIVPLLATTIFRKGRISHAS